MRSKSRTKDKGEWGWYIKTTNRNYKLNIIVSSIVALLVFIALLSDAKILRDYSILVGIFIVTFVFTFRVMEYILTRKSIFFLVYGSVDTGIDAFFHVGVYLIILFTILYFSLFT